MRLHKLNHKTTDKPHYNEKLSLMATNLYS